MFLKDSLAHGISWAEVAGFLGRTEEEVRQNSPRDFLELLVFGLTFMATYEGRWWGARGEGALPLRGEGAQGPSILRQPAICDQRHIMVRFSWSSPLHVFQPSYRARGLSWVGIRLPLHLHQAYRSKITCIHQAKEGRLDSRCSYICPL
jgi:hypothetical protein